MLIKFANPPHPFAAVFGVLFTTSILLCGCKSGDGSGDSVVHSAEADGDVESAVNTTSDESSATVPTPAGDMSADDEAESVDSTELSGGEITNPKPGVNSNVSGKFNELSPEEAFVILQKGTQPQSLGGYTMTMDPGTYICRQCNAILYRSEHKFESHCGWPSFDDEVPDAVKRVPDADGRRTEIVCKNCDGHLGHVFIGERLTDKNVRHCVNSISMKFIPEGEEIPEKITAEN